MTYRTTVTPTPTTKGVHPKQQHAQLSAQHATTREERTVNERAIDRYQVDERDRLIDSATGEMIRWGRDRDTAVAEAAQLNHAEQLYLSEGCEPYDRIAREAAAIGWPSHFRSDLERIDRHYLTVENITRFVWVLRENGTHIFPQAETTAEFSAIVPWLKAVANVYPDARWYVYSDGRLSHSSPDAARHFIAPQSMRAAATHAVMPA